MGWKKYCVLCFFLIGAVGLTNPGNRGNCTGVDCKINQISEPVRTFQNEIPAINDGQEQKGQDEPNITGETGELPVSNLLWNQEDGKSVAATNVSFLPRKIHSPRLNLILPRAIQRGQEHKLRFIGRNLDDAEELIFYSKGFQFREIKKIDKNQFSALVSVSEQVDPGRHLVQVRTRTGVSDFRPVWINVLPSVNEKESNNQFQSPQKIPLNVTVLGSCTNEDIDYFQVDCKKGQRLSVEISAMRLGSFQFDPSISILNAKRFEIAASDDSSFAGQDGVCCVKIPADGSYTVAVRESSFAGNPNCRYALHVGNFPRPSVLYPAGGRFGTKVKVRLLGDPLSDEEVEIEVPGNEETPFHYIANDAFGTSVSGNRFLTSPYPNSFQVEPNQYFPNATKIAFPTSVNGILEKPNDDDFYKFSAKKGQVWEIEVYAKRIGSPADPVFHIANSKRKYLVGNDDSRGQDSYVRFQVPEDGEYYFRVRDHLRRGGDDFVYRVEFRPAKPSLDISIPRTERYGQYRQTIFIPKGGRFGTVMMAGRKNFSGPVALVPEKMPTGVQIDSRPMPAYMTRMPVVFSATKEAELSSVLIPFAVQHHGPKKKISGHFQNKGDLVLGLPNNAVYQSEIVKKVPIAVIEELPFSVDIVQPKSPIVQGGTKNIQIKVTRKGKFKGAVRVEFPFRPQGVGTRGSIQIPAGKEIGNYPLNASSKARIAKWPIFAIGSASINGGKAYSSSQLAELEVAQAFLTCSMPRVSLEQEKEVLLECKLNHKNDFEGTASATLFGLPPGVLSKPQTFDKNTKKIVFKIIAGKDARIGKHRGVFLSIDCSGKRREGSITRRIDGTSGI